MTESHRPRILSTEDETLWVDPLPDGRGVAEFVLYPQPSRVADTDPQGSFFVTLPPGYEAGGERYPVIYWLHHGLASSHELLPLLEVLGTAMRDGRMRPSIIVAPQILPFGWFVDAKDGSRPQEQIVIHDLVTHVDAAYRTIADSSGRSVEGFSMGGYGALHLGLKYPRVFGRVSAIGPAILRDMSLEPEDRVANTFFGDAEYYALLHPWSIALGNAPEIRTNTFVRVLNGADDGRLTQEIRDFVARLAELSIPHEFVELENVGHNHLEIIERLGDAYYGFWQD